MNENRESIMRMARGAFETFNRVCPRSSRLAAFIGYTPPGERKPAIKTSPKWCPMRPENQKEEKDHE